MAKPKFEVVEGLKFAPGFQENNIRSVLEYKPADEDIFIVTYPKCGTTWTQQIVVLLQHDGHLPDGGYRKYSPFLEQRGMSSIQDLQRPFSMKTHIAATGHPWNPQAKYIIVLRNAKDAVVSFYYHQTSGGGYGIKGMSFDDFFEFWMDGEVECGSYFDWVLSWWPRRNLDNVLVVTYEDMKNDPKKEITKIAKFIGVDTNDELIDQTVEKSSFSAMKTAADATDPKRHNMRKGVVGDWTNHLSNEQNTRIEKLYHEKFDGTGLEHLWDQYDIFGKSLLP